FLVTVSGAGGVSGGSLTMGALHPPRKAQKIRKRRETNILKRDVRRGVWRTSLYEKGVSCWKESTVEALRELRGSRNRGSFFAIQLAQDILDHFCDGERTVDRLLGVGRFQGPELTVEEAVIKKMAVASF